MFPAMDSTGRPLGDRRLTAAFFSSGRRDLQEDRPYAALNQYACGIRHWLSKDGNIAGKLLDDEIAWLHQVHAGKPLPEEYHWAENLLLLAQCAHAGASQAATEAKISPPVLIVAGGAASLPPERAAVVELLLQEALQPLAGTVISGGSTSGVSGLVGKVAGNLARAGKKNFKLLGYIPHSLPHDTEKDRNYDQLLVCGADKFSATQVLCSWSDVLNAGIKPADLLLLGFGGGKISAFEYRLALALGATVGVVQWPGDAAEALINDPLWPVPNLFPLPQDAKTVRAFTFRDGYQFGQVGLVDIASGEGH